MTLPTIYKTSEFDRWFGSLRDDRARARILARIRRRSLGNFGDTKTLGGGISELRIDYGPGHRVCFASHRGSILLAHGGDKSSQESDIVRAREIAAGWEPAIGA